MTRPGRPKLAIDTQMLGVLLPAEMHARIRAVADASNRTMSAVVREVLAGFLAPKPPPPADEFRYRARCYGCCQENCGYTGCGCSCHD